MRRRDEYGQMIGFLSPLLERFRLRQAIPHISPGSSVLDIGCGRARVLKFIQPPSYLGLDVIPEVITRNRARYPQYEFALVNVEKEDVRVDRRFNVVLMLAVLEHLVQRAEVVGRVKGLLAAGGCIIVTTPHPRGRKVLEIGSRAGVFSSESQEEHHGLMDREELRGLAARCGLHLTRYQMFLLGMNQLAIFSE